MKKHNKFFVYEDIPFKKRVGDKVPRCWFLEQELSLPKSLAQDAFNGFKWIFRHIQSGLLLLGKWGLKWLKRAYKRYRNRKPRFFEFSVKFGQAIVTLKLSWVTVLFLSFMAYNFWPNQHIIAEPVQEKPIAEAKPLEQTKLEPIAPIVKPAPRPAVQIIPNCGDNQYAQYIYQHESGCNLYAKNAGGCLGIGQRCPGSVLLNACPNLDYACQNAHFTAYAIGRYGSWEAAYYKWLRSHWW